MVNSVAGKWKDLGVQLLPPEMVDIIAADHPHDVVSCCKCVLKKWLDTTTDATWNQLIKALRSPSVQLDCLAGQLEQVLIPEHHGNGYFTIVSFPDCFCSIFICGGGKRV